MKHRKSAWKWSPKLQLSSTRKVVCCLFYDHGLDAAVSLGSWLTDWFCWCFPFLGDISRVDETNLKIMWWKPRKIPLFVNFYIFHSLRYYFERHQILRAIPHVQILTCLPAAGLVALHVVMRTSDVHADTKNIFENSCCLMQIFCVYRFYLDLSLNSFLFPPV